MANKVDISFNAKTEEFKKSVNDIASHTKKVFKSVGDKLGKEFERIETVGTKAFNGILGVVSGVGAGVTAVITKTVKDSIDSFADYQQLEGGIQTLFGTGGKSIEDYADKVGKSVEDVKAEYEDLARAQDYLMNGSSGAFRNAGISANKYMEGIISFGASLRQSTDSSYDAAVKANQAMIDMSDNVNKMGTSWESVENAYKGFARQQFNMLDNLHIGYQGSNAEMARLINDTGVMGEAFEATAKNVKDVPLDKIFEAVHIAQERLGISGTTLDEAEHTLSGSINMFNAAWENLKSAIVMGGEPLTESINDVVWSMKKVIDNVGPALDSSFKGLLQLINYMIPEIFQQLPPKLMEYLPDIIKAGLALAEGLGTAFTSLLTEHLDISKSNKFLSELKESGVKIINNVTQGIVDNIDKISAIGSQIIDWAYKGMTEILPNFLQIAEGMIGTILEGFIMYKALIFEIGIRLITALAEGIADNSEMLMAEVETVFMRLLDVLIENLPSFLDSLVTILVTIGNSISENLPEILTKISTITHDLVQKLIDTFPQWGPAIWEIIKGILLVVADIIAVALATIIKNLVDWWNEKVKPWFDNLGENIKGFFDFLKQLFELWWNSKIKPWFENIKNHVVDWWNNVKSTVSERFNNIKSNISETASNIKTNLSEKFSSIKETVVEKVNSLKDSVVEKFTSLKTSISEKITALKTAVTDKFSEIKTTAKTKISEMVETVVQKIKELPDKMLSIGDNIVKGLWDGINGAASWLKEKVTGFVNGITGWFTGLFDEHSPSKVFEKIGSYLTEGLAIGIEDETGMLKNTAAKQVDQLKSVYNGISMGTPQLSFAGQMSSLSGMRQSVQTVTNDNGMVFNFTNYITGNGADAGDEIFRQFQRRVRYAGGVL